MLLRMKNFNFFFFGGGGSLKDSTFQGWGAGFMKNQFSRGLKSSYSITIHKYTKHNAADIPT